MHIVRHEDDTRFARPGERKEPFRDFLLRVQIEPGKGLVEQKDGRTRKSRLGKTCTAPLSAREFPGVLIFQMQGGEIAQNALDIQILQFLNAGREAQIACDRVSVEQWKALQCAEDMAGVPVLGAYQAA